MSEPQTIEEARMWAKEQGFGEGWTTDEAMKVFDFDSFGYPFAHVTRLSDGVKGTLQFIHDPRLYFNFRPSRRQ